MNNPAQKSSETIVNPYVKNLARVLLLYRTERKYHKVKQYRQCGKGEFKVRALDDIKILDLSSGIATSLATMYLASFGAEVTRLESPDGGDVARSWFPAKDGHSYYYNYLNSGKKSMTLDLNSKAGQEIFKKLVPQFDVVCVSSQPGVMEEWGLGYEDLKLLREDLIYASCTPYGLEGPRASKIASSLTVQALGVAMDMTGVEHGYPVSNQPELMEHYAAGYLATGILLAVIERKSTDQGQVVDISLQDSIFSCIEAAPAAASTIGEIQTRKGNFDPSCAPYDSFKTNDGYVTIGVATQAQWEKFCAVMGFQSLLEDPRFATNELRCQDYLTTLRPVLAEILEEWSKFDVEERCRSMGVPCCAVLAVDEICDMPNTIENGFIIEKMSEMLGNMKFPSLPFTLSGTPAEVFTDFAEVGEDTDAYLEAAGLSEDDIQRAHEEHVV